MYYYLIVFIIGAIIGSFLNVCIYRIPREISIIRPSSKCPYCSSPIKPYDNIPIFSYILLKGRCRNCNNPISIRYPIVEFLNACSYVIVMWRYGLTFTGVIFMAYFSVLIVITFIDLDFQIIPDIITIPGSLIGVITGSLLLSDSFNRITLLGFTQSIIGLILGFTLFLIIAEVSKGGMGGGDVKMMAMVGAFTGWKGVLLTTFIGSLVGSIIGIGLMLVKGWGRKSKIPFGPFLAIGSVITVLFGEEILKLYLGI